MNKAFAKLVSILLVVTMCVCLCSCQYIKKAISSLNEPSGIAEDISLGYMKMSNVSFEYSQHYTPYENKQSYQLLETDDMRKLYEMLLENVYYVYPQSNEELQYKTKQVVFEGVLLSEAQIRLTIKALTDDNPQIFFLSETFGFLVSEENNYTAVQLYSKMSPQQLQKKINELKGTVDGFLSTLRSGMTQYELELVIHDYILAVCEYDESVSADDAKELSNDNCVFDVYGALVNRKAVCEGYSRAFQLLCNAVGINCVNIIGQSHDELHMWNAIELGSDYYFVDVTWDDSEDDALKYDYFNINEEQLLADHEFSLLPSQMSDEQICGVGKLSALTSNFFIPQCDQTAYNYYVRTAPHLTSYQSDTVTQSLLKAAENKDSFFHIYIDPDKFNYSYAVDQLFFSSPQYFFDYASVVNSSLEDYSVDLSNISVYQKKQLCVATVALVYI